MERKQKKILMSTLIPVSVLALAAGIVTPCVISCNKNQNVRNITLTSTGCSLDILKNGETIECLIKPEYESKKISELLITIGSKKTLESSEYNFNTTSGKLVIPQTTLDKYNGDIAIIAVLDTKVTISLNKTTLDLAEGNSFKLVATVTGTSNPVTWSAANKELNEETHATVSQDGTVTGVSTGTSVITASVAGKSAKCTVNVVAAQSVEFYYPELTVIVDDTTEFNIPYETSDEVSNDTITWNSDSKSLTVDQTGKAKIAAGVAKAGDTINVSATIAGKTSTMKVRILPTNSMLYFVDDEPGVSCAVGVTGTKSELTSAKVPAIHNGKIVTSTIEHIEDATDNSFALCENLTEVELPLTIITISARSFEGCKKLKRMNSDEDGQLNIPNGCIVVKERAFKNCQGITYAYFPDSVLKTEKRLFDGDYWTGEEGKDMQFRGCRIPSNALEIDRLSFYDAEDPSAFAYFKWTCSIIYDKYGIYYAASHETPNKIEYFSIMCIGTEAVQPAEGFKIHEGVKNIPTDCEFYDFDKVVLPSSLKTISSSAISVDEIITSLEIVDTEDKPSNLQYIGVQGITGTKITSFRIPSNLKILCNEAFYNNTSLETIDLTGFVNPNSIPTIIGGTQPFVGCHANLKLYVANEEMKTAFSSAEGWSTYADRIEVKS